MPADTDVLVLAAIASRSGGQIARDATARLSGGSAMRLTLTAESWIAGRLCSTVLAGGSVRTVPASGSESCLAVSIRQSGGPHAVREINPSGAAFPWAFF